MPRRSLCWHAYRQLGSDIGLCRRKFSHEHIGAVGFEDPYCYSTHLRQNKDFADTDRLMPTVTSSKLFTWHVSYCFFLSRNTFVSKGDNPNCLIQCLCFVFRSFTDKHNFPCVCRRGVCLHVNMLIVRKTHNPC